MKFFPEREEHLSDINRIVAEITRTFKKIVLDARLRIFFFVAIPNVQYSGWSTKICQLNYLETVRDVDKYVERNLWDIERSSIIIVFFFLLLCFPIEIQKSH